MGKSLPQRGLRLPSLEWLERAGVRSIFSSFALSSLGLLSGFMLNLILGEISWTDPVVWGLLATHLAGVVVSLATAPPPTGLVSKLFDAPAIGTRQ